MAKQPAKGRKTQAKPKNTPDSAQAKPESASATQPQVDLIPAEVHAKAAPPDPEITPEKAQDEAAPVAPPQPDVPPAAPAPVKRSGFLPLVLGGLLAGVIGFAIGQFSAPAADSALVDRISAQASQINALEDRLAAVPSVDLGPIENGQSELMAQLSDLAARVSTLEEQPAAAVISDAEGAGFATDMDALRAQIAQMTDAARTELEAARAQAAAIEESATAAARNAAARAALARVQTALESGAPIGAPLGDLEDATAAPAPAALLAVQDGVPTLASLQDQFPDVARNALSVARAEGVAGEETTGFAAFLRNQLDVRSTTPQEGDSVDAILSRAEATVRAGRLSDALAEISALPEVVRAAMTDWLAQAEQRADAMAAVDILSTSLSDN